MLFCLLAAGCAQVQVRERHFIRPDAAPLAVEKQVARAHASQLALARPDGAMLRGLLFEQPGASSTILYFGGNMFHLDQHIDALLPVLAACGANVAVFDYRGYGRSSGTPTIANMAGDALAIFDAVDARFPGRVVVHGQSLGSFMAAHVAGARPVRATVLETTATSPLDLVESNVPWYARPFVRIDMAPSLLQVDNAAAAARFQSPALVIAAGRDKMTPARLGRKVYEAIPRQDKRLLFLEEAGHNDALQATGAGAAYCSFVRGA